MQLTKRNSSVFNLEEGTTDKKASFHSSQNIRTEGSKMLRAPNSRTSSSNDTLHVPFQKPTKLSMLVTSTSMVSLMSFLSDRVLHVSFVFAVDSCIVSRIKGFSIGTFSAFNKGSFCLASSVCFMASNCLVPVTISCGTTTRFGHRNQSQMLSKLGLCAFAGTCSHHFSLDHGRRISDGFKKPQRHF